MVNDNTNPFVLPGFGQSGDAAQNPLLASMEMMRNAWQGMAKAGGFEQVLGANISPQELEKRIADLRAVEQWLRMNLSMLSSTIQALEVQQATVSTLNSFLSTVSSNPNDAGNTPSPLEVALGIRPGVNTPETDKPKKQPEPPKETASINRNQDTSADSEPNPESKPASGDSTGLFAESNETIQQASEAAQAAQQVHLEQAMQASQAAEDATKRWWGMLQNQFDTLAEAAAATVQGVSQASEKFTETAGQTPKPSSDTKPAAKSTPATKSATQEPAKPVAKKATATKASAPAKATKKSSPKKATAKSKAAKKTVSKKSSAKKTTAKSTKKA